MWWQRIEWQCVYLLYFYICIRTQLQFLFVHQGKYPYDLKSLNVAYEVAFVKIIYILYISNISFLLFAWHYAGMQAFFLSTWMSSFTVAKLYLPCWTIWTSQNWNRIKTMFASREIWNQISVVLNLLLSQQFHLFTCGFCFFTLWIIFRKRWFISLIKWTASYVRKPKICNPPPPPQHLKWFVEEKKGTFWK